MQAQWKVRRAFPNAFNALNSAFFLIFYFECFVLPYLFAYFCFKEAVRSLLSFEMQVKSQSIVKLLAAQLKFTLLTNKCSIVGEYQEFEK